MNTYDDMKDCFYFTDYLAREVLPDKALVRSLVTKMFWDDRIDVRVHADSGLGVASTKPGVGPADCPLLMLTQGFVFDAHTYQFISLPHFTTFKHDDGSPSHVEFGRRLTSLDEETFTVDVTPLYPGKSIHLFPWAGKLYLSTLESICELSSETDTACPVLRQASDLLLRANPCLEGLKHWIGDQDGSSWNVSYTFTLVTSGSSPLRLICSSTTLIGRSKDILGRVLRIPNNEAYPQLGIYGVKFAQETGICVSKSAPVVLSVEGFLGGDFVQDLCILSPTAQAAGATKLLVSSSFLDEGDTFGTIVHQYLIDLLPTEEPT